MKTFYVHLLLVVITINYVQGGSQSDHSENSTNPSEQSDLDDDECDPLAANTKHDARRSGADLMNQVIPIKEFLRYKMSNNYVARATPDPIETTGATSPRFCHVPYFNKDCGPLHYAQEVADVYDPDREDGFKNIRLKTTFVAMNLENGKAILYNMDVEGVNKDDYIFKWVENTPITAYEIGDNGEKTEITTIPENVLHSLKQRFALNRIGLSEPTDSSEDSQKKKKHEKDVSTAQDAAEEVQPVDYKQKGILQTEGGSQDKTVKVEMEEDDDKFNMENRVYMIYITCDGTSLWTAFNRSVVDSFDEARHAAIMDRQVQELQKSSLAVTEEYPFVKSISTYMPARFDEYVPKGPETNIITVP